MKAQHTPGILRAALKLHKMYNAGHITSPIETAKIIANETATPELLEALKDILHDFTRETDIFDCQAGIAAAFAAIAKAEGK